MTVRVVHALEVIDVEHHQRQIRSVPAREGELHPELAVEMLAVVRARERVRHARLVELAQKLLLPLVGERIAEYRLRSELNQVAVAQHGPFDLLPADERPVGRLRVLDDVRAVLEQNRGVLAAHTVVAQPDFALVGAADPVQLVTELQHVPELGAACADEQVAVLGLTLRAALAQVRQIDHGGPLQRIVVVTEHEPLLGVVFTHYGCPTSSQ